MPPPFRILGLGGGGMKGILHVGALKELSKHQTLDFPDGVYGASIGSILATYVAFKLPLDSLVPFIKKNSSLDSAIPKFSLTQIPRALTTKGLYSLDILEKLIVELFDSQNVDIRKKKLGDAHMPLHIISTNITKRCPTIFSKDVLILDALKSSCCIPGLFQPYEIYGQLYVDGGHMYPCIAPLVPKGPHTLVLTLSKQRKRKLTPSLVESMSPLVYASELYTLTIGACHDSQRNEHTCSLKYHKLFSDSDLSEFDTDKVLAHSASQLSRFLTSQILD
jgi:predicted acylesterase/phospholipase RssA